MSESLSLASGAVLEEVAAAVGIRRLRICYLNRPVSGLTYICTKKFTHKCKDLTRGLSGGSISSSSSESTLLILALFDAGGWEEDSLPVLVRLLVL